MLASREAATKGEEGVLFVWDVALSENQNAVAVSSNKRAAQHTCDPLL